MVPELYGVNPFSRRRQFLGALSASCNSAVEQ
jgi:hypothetical protein